MSSGRVSRFPSPRAAPLRPMTREEFADLPLGERIKHVRKKHGPTQAKFADLLGTTANRVNAWERGRSVPGEEYAEKIAALEGCPASVFQPATRPPFDLQTALAQIIALIETGTARRHAWSDALEAELKDQLASQTALLAQLATMADELRKANGELVDVATDLRAAISELQQQVQRRRRA